jgi:hypothetical protein
LKSRIPTIGGADQWDENRSPHLRVIQINESDTLKLKTFNKNLTQILFLNHFAPNEYQITPRYLELKSI